MADSGEDNGFHRDSESTTLLARVTLAAGDNVSVHCNALVGDENEAAVNASLLLEHFSS